MPKFIPVRNVDRMFPFEFYEELREVFDEFVPLSSVFTLMYSKHADAVDMLKKPEERKKFYDGEKKESIELRRHLAQENLVELDATPVLLLTPVVPKEDIDVNTGKLKEGSKLNGSAPDDYLEPSHQLCVQLYDSAQEPVFCKDTSLDIIHKIPEILWDDPNLLIGVISITDDGAQFMVIKAPIFIQEKWQMEDKEDE